MTQLMRAGLPDADGAAESLGETSRIDHMIASAAKCFDEFIVSYATHENSWRRIRVPATIDAVTAVNAAVVEDHDDDRQVITAVSFDLHSTEAERAVAFDGDERLTAHDGLAELVM
jgi:hypothetical protein